MNEVETKEKAHDKRANNRPFIFEEKPRATVFNPLDENHLNEIEALGETTFREQYQKLVIKTADR